MALNLTADSLRVQYVMKTAINATITAAGRHTIAMISG